MKEELLNKKLKEFNSYLLEDEKDRSVNTIKKYKSVVRDFILWVYDFKRIKEKDLTRTIVKEYRDILIKKYENFRTINNRICIVNVYLKMLNLKQCTVKTLVYEEDMCKPDDRYLNIDEYYKLINCLNIKYEDEVLMAIIYGGTGIRVSELKYFTIEAVKTNVVYVINKGKKRPVYLSKFVKDEILKYCKRNKITSGPILLSNRKTPYERTTILRKLKRLAVDVGVDPKKVFPHSFRHLFAHMHYKKYNDIEALSHVLGHKNIKTTKIYIRKTASEYVKYIEVFDYDKVKCNRRIKLLHILE